MVDTTATKIFRACDETLRAAYKGSTFSGGGQAKSRTCTNRETLVRDLFERMLPLATRTIHGAMFVDAHGGESGDVDVAIVAPWGAPVWPFQAHPLVPCEGVISGVFCESSTPGRTAVVWSQISGARSLFKRVAPDKHTKSPRALTPNLGLWSWADAVTSARFEQLLDEARDDARDSALLLNAKQHAPKAIDPDRYATRVLAAGAHTPNWVYWHGTEASRAAFAFRIHKLDSGWNDDKLMEGLDRTGTTETKVWKSSDGHYEWKYVFVTADAQNARALKALVAYLSTQVVLYGSESPQYGAYANTVVRRGSRPPSA